MKILVACERSGVVRQAFAQAGHNAWSCDLVETSLPGQHIIADVLTILGDGWDMMIAHPPCTYLSRAGARWMDEKRERLAQLAMQFAIDLALAPIERIAIENPIGRLWRWRKPDQIIQPYEFGDPFMKTTCLWLKNMPPLMATLICSEYQVNWTEYGHRNAIERSKTFPGIARAMAQQWGAR